MKEIPLYEGLYEIDTFGSVYSVLAKKILKQTINERGYKTVCLHRNRKCTTCLIHRLVAITYIENPLNLPYVDHIDGDANNNALKNLRWCSAIQNSANTRKYWRDTFTSTYKGVSKDKRTGRWKVRLSVNKKQKFLGAYETEIKAALAYNKYAVTYYGEFAKLNIVKSEV